VPEGHAPGGLVAQRDGGDVGVAEGAAALDEAGEDGVEIAGAGDLAGDVDEALGLTAAMLGLLEEACVLENEGGLVGEGADEIEIGGAEAPAGAVAGGENANDAAASAQRDGERGTIGGGLEDLTQWWGQDDAWICEGVVDDDGATLADPRGERGRRCPCPGARGAEDLQSGRWYRRRRLR